MDRAGGEMGRRRADSRGGPGIARGKSPQGQIKRARIPGENARPGSTQPGETAQSVFRGFCRPARRPEPDIRVVGAEHGCKCYFWEEAIAGKKASFSSI